MNTVNIENARKNLNKLLTNINKSHQPVYIIGKNNSAVIIAENDWKAIEKTLYLKESIIEGLKEPIKNCSAKLDW